jgi:hypothetical protein
MANPPLTSGTEAMTGHRGVCKLHQTHVQGIVLHGE